MLQFPTGVPIHFDKLLPSTNRTKQQREAIKAMERQGKKVEPEIPQSSKDLSMANRVPFVLLEYSVRSISLDPLPMAIDELTRLVSLGTGRNPSGFAWLRNGFEYDQLLQEDHYRRYRSAIGK